MVEGIQDSSTDSRLGLNFQESFRQKVLIWCYLIKEKVLDCFWKNFIKYEQISNVTTAIHTQYYCKLLFVTKYHF